jgi:hypothetical protein
MTILTGYLLLCIIGAILQGISGIGFSMFFMAFCPLLVSYTIAANSNRLIGLALAVCGLLQWREGVRWKLLLPPLTASLACSALGVETFVRADEEILKRLLGILLLVLSAGTWFLQKRDIRIHPNALSGLVFGAVAGFASGLFGILGPILAIYYVSATEQTEEYKGTLNMHFVILSLWNNLFYGLQYGYQSVEIGLSVMGAAGAITAMLVVFRLEISRQRDKAASFMLFLTSVMAVTMLF